MTPRPRFVAPVGTVVCDVDGEVLELPVFVGVLKHPDADQLRELLADPIVVHKYTCEALRRLPWSALRRFPRKWLAACLPRAGLPAGRRRAVEFMLGGHDDDDGRCGTTEPR
jgi:hypothetical protein